PPIPPWADLGPRLTLRLGSACRTSASAREEAARTTGTRVTQVWAHARVADMPPRRNRERRAVARREPRALTRQPDLRPAAPAPIFATTPTRRLTATATTRSG